MTSFHELSWPTKALSVGAALVVLLSIAACSSDDAKNGQTPSTVSVPDEGYPSLTEEVSSDRVFFDYDSVVLRPDARATLDEVAAWLFKYPKMGVYIEGHCDERGTREYNLALGERRAQAVANYLAAAGIDSSRMETISYGKERPAVVGSDETAWAQNRRAVFVQLN